MTTSSSTSLLLMATRISSSSLQVVSVHWLRSTIVGWDSFSSCCMIFEKWSREATIRQSWPFFLRPSRDLENSFLTSQSKSFTRCGSLKHWVHKTKWLWICYTSCEVINKWMNGATFYITPYEMGEKDRLLAIIIIKFHSTCWILRNGNLHKV